MRFNETINILKPPFLIVILFYAISGYCQNTNSLSDSSLVLNEQHKRIVILNSWGTGLPIPDETKQGIQIALEDGGISMADIFFEDLDLVRASSKEHRLRLVSLLSHKLDQNQVSIVLLIGSTALEFMANEGKELFPNAVLISLITPNVNSLNNDLRKIMHLPWRVDPSGSVELAKELFPNTNHVFVITGAKDGVLPFLKDAKKSFIPLESQLDFEYSNEMTYEEMIQRTSSLTKGSIILYSTFFTDKLNRSFIPFEVVSEVCRNSKVPVFATLEYYMGLGIIGGALLETEKLGKQAGNIALDYLNGQIELTEHVTRFDTPIHSMVDWQELSSFQSHKTNIPEDCIIVGKPLTFWEQYKLLVTLVTSVILVLSSLIVTLLFWNRRIRKIRSAVLESEARFRVMIENAPEAVIVVDIGTDKIVDANAKAEQLFGCSREELFKGSPSLFYKDSQPDKLSIDESMAINISLALQGKEAVFERAILSKDGRDLICEVRFVQLPNPKHQLLRGSYIDITKRKQLEEELINTKEHAIESDRLKSAFLANMSHEIRTPMNGILGFAELLKDHNLSGKEQKKYINIIETSGSRLLNIVNDIINISKIESKQMEVVLSKTNINEQIDFLISFFKPEAEAKGLNIILTGSLPISEAEITTDQEKVYAILTNLIKNAVKFTNHGSVELCAKKKGDFIEFSVKDTGLGISLEQKDYVFKRFTNSPEFLNKTQRGAGLGLSISKGYVEILGGKIWVDSEPGVGSTFYFTLPCNVKNN